MHKQQPRIYKRVGHVWQKCGNQAPDLTSFLS